MKFDVVSIDTVSARKDRCHLAVVFDACEAAREKFPELRDPELRTVKVEYVVGTREGGSIRFDDGEFRMSDVVLQQLMDDEDFLHQIHLDGWEACAYVRDCARSSN